MIDGYLYCFSNESMPGILKVGMTERIPNMRLNEANTSDTWRPPTPYKFEFAKKVYNPKQKERTLHMLLSKYTERINPRREFFRVSLEEVNTFFELMDGELYIKNITKEENKEENKEDEVAKFEYQSEETKQEKLIKYATENLDKLREQIRELDKKESQILSRHCDENLINSELNEQKKPDINLTIIPRVKSIKIAEPKEDKTQRVRDTSKIRPNLQELFNTDTEIKFKIGKTPYILNYEVGKGMLLNNKRFTTLASVITEIKKIEQITKTRQYNAYDFTEWFSKKDGKFLPTSPYFTIEILEQNRKLN
jgi:hypothetical protein